MGFAFKPRVRDFSSAELAIEGQIFDEISNVEYSDSVDRERVPARDPRGAGMTRGTYEAEGTVTFSTDEAFRRFLAELGDGYYDKVFTVTYTYQIPGGDVTTDKLKICQLSELPGGAESGGAIEREVSFTIGEVERGGLKPFEVQ